MAGEFSGLHAVVTGGTGALGTAVVSRIVGEGGRVSIPVHDEREVERFPLRSDDRVKLVRGVDLKAEKAVEGFYREAVQWGGGLWASLHIAGGFGMKPFAETTGEEWVSLVQMNLLTCFFCCREAVRVMKASGGAGTSGGRIVNVAARPALEPRQGAGMVAYTVGKAGVAAITQAVAEEVAADGILVNAVVPSIMDTAANRKSMPGADFSKWPKVEEVALAMCFLASPRNTVVRGGLVPVYGKS